MDSVGMHVDNRYVTTDSEPMVPLLQSRDDSNLRACRPPRASVWPSCVDVLLALHQDLVTCLLTPTARWREQLDNASG